MQNFGASAPAPPAWAPSDLAKLSQWHDAFTYHTGTMGFRWPLLDAARTGTIREPRAARCAVFDGGNDYAVTPGRVTSGALTAFSCSVWFKKSTSGAIQVFASEYSQTAGQRAWYFGFAASGALVAVVSSDGTALTGTYTTTATTYADGNWHHAVLVYESSTIRIDIDGATAAGSVVGAIPASLFNSTTNFAMGATNSGGGGQFGGSIGEVRVYSTAKSLAETQAIYNQANTPTAYDTAGLRAWYACDEECCSIIHDSSGNGNHATVINASTLPGGTFWASDSTLPFSLINEYGGNYGVTMLKNSSGTWSGGWISSNTLTGDGYVEFVVDALANTAAFGLTTNSTLGAATNLHLQLDFGVAWVTGGTTIQLYERGAAATPACTLAIGDRVRIVRTGTAVKVQQNGVDVATFAGTSSATLRAMMASNATTLTPDCSSFNGANPTTLATQTCQVNRHIIPRSLASPTLDVFGNTCNYTGQVPHLSTSETPCVTGNGTDAYVDFGAPLIPASADFTLSFLYYHPSVDATQRNVFSQWASGQAGRIHVRVLNNSQLHLLYNDSQILALSTGVMAIGWHRITLTRTGNDYTLSVQNFANRTMVSGTVTQLGAIYTGRNTYGLIQAAATAPNEGAICDLSITTGGVTKYFHLQEGPGSGATNRTLYGWASDGSAVPTGSLVNGTVADLWAANCPHAKDYAIANGCRVASGVTIPKGSGATAADGNALTHSAGEWSNETRNNRLNFNPYSAALLNGLGVETAYVGAAARESVSPNSTKFRRTLAGSDLEDDRFFTAYASRSGIAAPVGLSGADLTSAQAYVA